MFDVGGGELILILLVVLLLFGPSKLPELARSVGKGLRTMRKAQEDLTQQIRDISADVASPAASVVSDVQRTITVNIDPDAVARTSPPRATPEPEPPTTTSTDEPTAP